MLTIQEARGRVANGAQWLDGIEPGWAGSVDPGLLSMSSSCLCVLGQACGGYFRAVETYGWNQLSDQSMCYSPEAVALGFGIGPTDVEDRGPFSEEADAAYSTLQDCWIREIADRVVCSRNAPQEAQAVDAVAGNSQVNAGCTVRA